MAIASIANWLFNFAIGIFIPPAFVSYPETARKSLEEIEEMWRPGGPKPCQTKIGDSHL